MPVQSGPLQPGSAASEQLRVTVVESDLTGTVLVHAGGNPLPQGHKGRVHAQAGILGNLCVSQESAGIRGNKHELDSRLLPVARLLLQPPPHLVKDELLNCQVGDTIT